MKWLAKILWWLKSGKNVGRTGCQRNAIEQAKIYKRFDYKVRYGHGFYNGNPHMWTEYLTDGKWIKAEDTVKGDGHYKVTWYGVPQ